MSVTAKSFLSAHYTVSNNVLLALPQYTKFQCIALHSIVVQCNVFEYSTVQLSLVQCSVVLNFAEQVSMVRFIIDVQHYYIVSLAIADVGTY